MGPLILSPGSWCTQGSVCVLQESTFPVLCKFWQLYDGVNCNLPQEGLWSYPSLLYPGPLPLWQATADPYLRRRPSDTQRQVWLSLCGVFWCRQHFVWALWMSLVGMGSDSKHGFGPPTILVGLLLCPWTWVSSFGGIKHSPVDGCSAAGCNCAVLAWEDEHTSFFSAIFLCFYLSLFNKWCILKNIQF